MDTDLTGMVARIDDLEQRHEHDQMALKSNAKQMEEMRAENEALRQRLEDSERARRMYFLESESYRKALERYRLQQCEGYIWGEPA